MDDGYIVPGNPDGMATFAGTNGTTILIRNHEVEPSDLPGPFGANDELLKASDRSLLYDLGAGQTPHRGGTTTLIYDTKQRKLRRQFLSLGGTSRNCSGGPTPWRTWISCEETVIKTGSDNGYWCDCDHGFNFEVPATDEPSLAKAVPLTEMGRFNHEAVAVDPQTSIVYQSEDRDDGLIYRFIPHLPGQLAAGGRLQALQLTDSLSADLRNWGYGRDIAIGQPQNVRWVDVDNVAAPDDDLRYRGFGQGAARFARAEGMWYAHGTIYFACTSGGRKRKGQIWKYTPWPSPNKNRLNQGGTLELFVEPNNYALLEAADNLTAAPWGDLIVCEDRQGEQVRLVGITPSGSLYTFANSHAKSEFSGATFSPDGSTLFVNIQHLGLTLAISGPWQSSDT
jgi:secreted PhoX family phosphatase